MKRSVIALVLVIGCGSHFDVEFVPVGVGFDTTEPVLVSDAEVEAPEVPVDAGEAPPPPPPPSIPAAMAVPTPDPHQNPRYMARCRVESRRDAALSEVVEDRDLARSRARALARSGSLDPVLILARMAYGEHGTPQRNVNDDPATPEWDEAWAVLAVIDSLRGQASRVEMMVNYAPRRVFPGTEVNRQRWISEVQLDGSRPPSWPAVRGARVAVHPGWKTYGCPRWLATVDAVRRLLRRHRDRVESGPCEETPDHWGGEMDDHRAEARGWRRVQCGAGNTLNHFWVVPVREREREARPDQNSISIVAPVGVSSLALASSSTTSSSL